MRKLTAAIVFALLNTAGGAGAAEIRALISTAVAAAMDELVPQFELASGHTLRITYGPSGGVAKRLTDGDAADLIILSVQNPWFVIRGSWLVARGSWLVARGSWFVVGDAGFITRD